jgi:hypothetical protein
MAVNPWNFTAPRGILRHIRLRRGACDSFENEKFRHEEEFSDDLNYSIPLSYDDEGGIIKELIEI